MQINHDFQADHAIPSPLIDTTLGMVVEMSGSGAVARFDIEALAALSQNGDPGLAMAGQVGSQVKVRVGRGWLIASVRSLKNDVQHANAILAALDFLGEGDEERLTGTLTNFRRGVTRFPVPGAPVGAVSVADMKQMYAASQEAHIEVGTVYPTEDVRGAIYIDPFLGKHFAILGSTGTGKSTATAAILHKICAFAPRGHIVMIDPHGEYAAAFRTTGELFDVSNLAIPYWLLNFEELCEVLVTSRGDNRQIDADILSKSVLAAKTKSRAAEGIGKLTVDAPIPYLLSDLSTILQNEMGRLDKAGDTAPFIRLKSRLDELRADPRYSFMFSGMLVADTMAQTLAKLFRLPTDGKPISIIDVSGVPSEITSVVVAVLARMVFDYALWSRDEPQRPILLVCEEAHRYVPSERTAHGSSVGKILSRIAKEGRKYGVSLGLITQRPSDLAEGVLSQCGTIVTMRLNNERDQAFVRAAMPEGARGFLDTIPALRNRECVISGEGVSVPIRVALDTVEPSKRPASQDPLFSQLWQEAGGEEDILERVIRRWRSQGR